MAPLRSKVLQPPELEAEIKMKTSLYLEACSFGAYHNLNASMFSTSLTCFLVYLVTVPLSLKTSLRKRTTQRKISNKENAKQHLEIR